MRAKTARAGFAERALAHAAQARMTAGEGGSFTIINFCNIG
ncbi:MAG: hypothetical protein ACREJ0_21465 [Geminicoccaceae bacterium]